MKFFPPFLLMDPGWKKIRIRDKRPGSATLPKSFQSLQILQAIRAAEQRPLQAGGVLCAGCLRSSGGARRDRHQPG